MEDQGNFLAKFTCGFVQSPLETSFVATQQALKIHLFYCFSPHDVFGPPLMYVGLLILSQGPVIMGM